VKLKKNINLRNIELKERIENAAEKIGDLKKNIDKCMVDGVFQYNAFIKVFSALKQLTS